MGMIETVLPLRRFPAVGVLPIGLAALLALSLAAQPSAPAPYTVLTRDARRYRTYFPTVELITPSESVG